MAGDKLKHIQCENRDSTTNHLSSGDRCSGQFILPLANDVSFSTVGGMYIAAITHSYTGANQTIDYACAVATGHMFTYVDL